MIRWTTPTLILTIKGIDLTACDVYVTVEQGSKEITLQAAVSYDDPNTVLTVEYTQAQTSLLHIGEAEIQANWVKDGRRDATLPKTIYVEKNLLDEEI